MCEGNVITMYEANVNSLFFESTFLKTNTLDLRFHLSVSGIFSWFYDFSEDVLDCSVNSSSNWSDGIMIAVVLATKMKYNFLIISSAGECKCVNGWVHSSDKSIDF